MEQPLAIVKRMAGGHEGNGVTETARRVLAAHGGER